MNEAKKMLQSFSIPNSIGFAIIIPVIIFKVLKAVYLNKKYNSLAGKVVVITGASSGLGEALAHEFYKRGCQVVLCARRRQELERVRTDLLHTHCNVTTRPPVIIPLDVSDAESLPNQVDRICSISGKIDILINNAGVSHRGLAAETSLDVDLKIMKVNYFGAVALTKAVLPGMLKHKAGHIVFISSVQGLFAIPERSAYAASKHALQAFSDSLRAELASKNIQVTVISPGYIKTNLSLNALTGSGAVHGQMDKTTESGVSAEYAAREIVKAIVQKKKEQIIAGFVPRLGLFLRKYLPNTYFMIMEYRAKKLVAKT